ncbi:hypothetical protein [Malaciobacter mytili]|uniref:hypothetical protein n=1 Tax=Malaciobacter mytili TaxID=603050 RepID=UPI003A83BA30
MKILLKELIQAFLLVFVLFVLVDYFFIAPNIIAIKESGVENWMRDNGINFIHIYLFVWLIFWYIFIKDGQKILNKYSNLKKKEGEK